MRIKLLVVVLLFAGVAEAGIEVRNFSVTALSDGTYHYTYRLRLVSGRLDPGSGVPQIVTLYDVPGVIPGSLSVTSPWGGNLQLTGNDPAEIPRGASDNPSVQNVALKFTGASTIYAPADVGSFSFRVPAGSSGWLVYATQSVSPYTGGIGVVGRVSGPR